ncbi:alpha/beta fold hydrolase [Aliikangiella sp. G2MR2-5]|uniref:alpha/beta fold hydrolase n=1 Tax=Aliikangiella sp. G2MR2-5 TaxID=2788943 RepID=UPI0018A9F8D3|nr:alpha/beta hydrolase [Aliikangiella sp. G2MR2-5]
MVEYQLNLSGCECAVAEWNPESNNLVFALHGWLDNLATFQKLAECMPELRIVAVDFPGHGHSAHLEEGLAYHFYDGIYLISDLAKHFKQKKIKLLGHSMGAAISSVFAASQPELVSGLVMIESLGPLTASEEEIQELFANSIVQRQLLASKKKPVYPDFESALRVRAEASKIAPEHIKPLVERGLDRVNEGYTWRADSRLRVISPIRLSEPFLRNLLNQITCPVLLIEGSQGYLAGVEKFQQRKTCYQQLQQVKLVGGHHVHLEQPSDSAEHITGFFSKID